MKMIFVILIFIIVMLLVINIINENKVKRLESEVKYLKEDMKEIRGVIYK